MFNQYLRLNLSSTTATLETEENGRCREVQLYLTFKLLYLPEYNVKNYEDPPR